MEQKIKDLFNRFVLFTDERKIAFLFNDNGTQPYTVEKSGPQTAIESEYKNHMMAEELLGNIVPKLGKLQLKTGHASFNLEYVPEILLSNIIATAFLNKKKKYCNEVISILDFYLDVFIAFFENSQFVFGTLAEDELSKITSSLFNGSFKSHCIQELKVQFSRSKNIKFSRMLQHGDFGIRNILYASKNRKVLIDWEDMHVATFPLLDYVMLLVSIELLYEEIIEENSKNLFRVFVVKNKQLNLQNRIQTYLEMSNEDFKILTFLCTASLCHQNLVKGRKSTAQLLFNELEKQVLAQSNIVNFQV